MSELIYDKLFNIAKVVFMSKIDDYDLVLRKNKRMSNHLQAQAYIELMNNSDANKSASAITAKIAGRSVSSVNKAFTKELSLFQNHVASTTQDRQHNDHVKSTSKSESHHYY